MAGFLDEFKDAFAKRNNGLIQLIVINVVVFLFLILIKGILLLSQSVAVYNTLLSYIKLPASLPVLLYRPWTLLTYAFAHEDPFHILFNMLTLYWFGRLIQEYIGSKRLVNLYILGAIAGGLTFLLVYNLFPIFKGSAIQATLIGSSASGLAVVVAAATLLPNYTFFMLFLGPIRIKYIAAFMVILSWVSTSGNNAGGNFAHLGGALFGYVFILLLKNGTDLGSPITSTLDFIAKLFKPSPRQTSNNRPSMKVTYRSEKSQSGGLYANTSSSDYPDDAEVDSILDKISKSGYESLSKEEKQKLFKASQKS